MRIGVKPYPACRYTHAAVDDLLQLKSIHGWVPEDVTAITVGLHRNGIALVGAPLTDKQNARSIVEGQFSMPYAAAVALIRGRFGWDDYDLLGDALAERLAARVNVVRDDSLEGLHHPFGATLRVEAAGKIHDLRIADPSGEAETFPDADAIACKFMALTGPVSNGNASAWLRRLSELRNAQSVRAQIG